VLYFKAFSYISLEKVTEKSQSSSFPEGIRTRYSRVRVICQVYLMCLFRILTADFRGFPTTTQLNFGKVS